MFKWGYDVGLKDADVEEDSPLWAKHGALFEGTQAPTSEIPASASEGEANNLWLGMEALPLMPTLLHPFLLFLVMFDDLENKKNFYHFAAGWPLACLLELWVQYSLFFFVWNAFVVGCLLPFSK